MVRKGAKTKGEGTSSSEHVKSAWRAFLAGKRLHESRPRDTVVDAFLEITDHIDLETLLEAARRRDPSVSMATVYRTMKLMEEAGLAHAQHFTTGPAVYEVAIGRDHLICEGPRPVARTWSPRRWGKLLPDAEVAISDVEQKDGM